MTQEKPQNWLHWSKKTALWLLIPVGALITKDIYDYVKVVAAFSKPNPAVTTVQKPEAEKPPAPARGIGSGALREQVTKVLSQGPPPILRGDSKEEKKVLIPLIMAAKNGHIKVVEILLQRGADVNVRDKEQGVTALIVAAQQGHAQVVELLLKNGAEVNASDTDGKTALSEALRNQHGEIVKLLHERGAH